MMCRTQLSLCAGNALSHTTSVVVNEPAKYVTVKCTHFHSMQEMFCVTPFFALYLVFEVNVSAKCVVIQVDGPLHPRLD